MMVAAPLRRVFRLWPVIISVTAVIGVVLWRRSHPNFRPALTGKHDADWISVRLQKNQREYIDKRGIHVVVGHYIGDNLLNGKSSNFTKDVVNANNYSPRTNAGKDGQPVVIEPKDLLKMQQLFQINKFNLLASDRIPLNRTIPDVRKKRCQNKYKDLSGLPDTSVIIVFHNEAWSTLLRTVWSVINRSPKQLLNEILLVDDASDRDFLRQPLEDYVAKLPVKTTVLRTKDRVGLVHARLMGAKVAQGQVLTFLDAHCECSVGWLESLLHRIAGDRKRVVCPVIDIISDDTFAYIKSFELHWGAFNWALHFRWFTLRGDELQKRKKDITEPFFTPTMAGGLFSIDKSYFYELGGYDDQLKIWGGENLELSFKVWQCGGTVEIVPCSHVGHLFRKSSPYTFPGGVNEILYSNLARVALVWMDEWGDFFFKFNPEARKMKDRQDVEERIQLRKKLKCKSFKWYLENIWPQHFFPMDNRFFGRIKNVEQNQCLIKPIGKGSLNQPTGIALLNECLKEDNLIEMFIVNPDGAIATDDSVCLDAPDKETPLHVKVNIIGCSGVQRQKWSYNNKTLELKHTVTGLCLDVASSKKHEDGLTVVKCSGVKSQQWLLEPVSWR